MAKAFLVVRIKGQADVPHWANTTLNLLNLEKKYRAVIIPAKENTLGMLRKVQHYLSWQEIDIETTKECEKINELITITKDDLEKTQYSLDINEYIEEKEDNFENMIRLSEICELEKGEIQSSKRIEVYNRK